VLAAPIAADTGWLLGWAIGGLSLGLLAAGLISPVIGRTIARHGVRPVLAISAGLLAGGLLELAVAQFRPAYLIAWTCSVAAWARAFTIPPLPPWAASTVKVGGRRSPS